MKEKKEKEKEKKREKDKKGGGEGNTKIDPPAPSSPLLTPPICTGGFIHYPFPPPPSFLKPPAASIYQNQSFGRGRQHEGNLPLSVFRFPFLPHFSLLHI